MKRLLLTVAFVFVCSTPVHAGPFERLAESIIAMNNALRPNVVPSGPVKPVSNECLDCNGTGRQGDGRIEFKCAKCNGTGKVQSSSGGPPDNYGSPPQAGQSCRRNADGSWSCGPSTSFGVGPIRRLFGR